MARLSLNSSLAVVLEGNKDSTFGFNISFAKAFCTIVLAVVLSRKKGTITLKRCGEKCCKIEVILYMVKFVTLYFSFPRCHEILPPNVH